MTYAIVRKGSTEPVRGGAVKQQPLVFTDRKLADRTLNRLNGCLDPKDARQAEAQFELIEVP